MTASMMLWQSGIAHIRKYLIAMVLVAWAASLRVWPLQQLGTILVWLTFYPAIVVAAAYGGFWVGISAMLASCLTVLYLWPFLVTEPFIRTPADWVGLWVFVLNSVLISGVAEAMLRAKEQARLAQRKRPTAPPTNPLQPLRPCCIFKGAGNDEARKGGSLARAS